MSKAESEKLARAEQLFRLCEVVGLEMKPHSWFKQRHVMRGGMLPEEPTPALIFGTEADSGSDGLLELSRQRGKYVIVEPFVGSEVSNNRLWIAIFADGKADPCLTPSPTLAAYQALLKAWEIE